MRTLLVFLLWAGPLFTLTAQTTWRWSNPQPHGANVVDMTEKLGVKIQVGEAGQLFASEDMLLWQAKPTGVTNSLRAVTFLGQRLIVTAERGLILYADSLEEFFSVDLGTADWLEAVTASDQRAVAVGDNGAIYTSTDGVDWGDPKSLPGNNKTWLRGVAYGGSTFVAVGEGGYIATGNNSASSWTTRTSGVTEHLNRAAYIGSKFWVVGNNGHILFSPNGTAWTKVTSVNVTNNLFAVAGTNSTILVAGDQIALLSEDDGATWKTQTATPDAAQPAPKWTYYSALHTEGIFLLSGRSGMTLEGFKTNATAQVWVERNDSHRQWLWSVQRFPDFYLAVGDHGTLLTSARGVNWELELTPDAATNSILLGVGGTTNGAVAVGNKGTILFSPTNFVSVLYTNLDSTVTSNYVSTLGTFWQAVTPAPVSVDLQGVAYKNGIYVVCGGTGTILTSPDGTNWTSRLTLTTSFLSSVAAGPSQFVAVGNNGTILTSSDGVVWLANLIPPTSRWLFKVKYFDGTFIAVGENGTILTSETGLLWATRNSGVTNWLNDVEKVNGEYFVAGNQGTLLRSTDLATWTPGSLPTKKSLFGLASFGGQLVAAGVEGALLRMQLTPDVTPVKFVDYGKVLNQSLVQLSGNTDQKFTLDTSTNLVDWVEGVTFEIVDRSGTLLIKQSTDTNATNREFYRARMVP